MAQNRDKDQDTICAEITPPGVGGVSTIRVSGPNCWNIVRKAADFLPDQPSSHQAYYGYLSDQSGVTIDEVIVLYFAEGRSFTGESTVEISSHGNPLIVQSILDQLIIFGARLATRGEFTYRAFMNGRIDLTQAEAVLSVIQANSARAKNQALDVLRGSLSSRLLGIEDQLTWSLAHIEAGIDFSTEGLEVVDPMLLKSKVLDVLTQLNGLIESYQASRIVRDGLKVALIGEPNAGKSSLFNALLGQDRAIVSDIAGTTRDFVESSFFFGGIRMSVFDTAGIRESQDTIEKMGIDRSRQIANRSDVNILVVDVSSDILKLQNVADLLKGSKTIVFLNKVDLLDPTNSANKLELLKDRIVEELKTVSTSDEIIFLVGSAKSELNLDILKMTLLKTAKLNSIRSDSIIDTHRQFENLSRAIEYIKQALAMLNDDAGPELVAIELKDALILIQETMGKRFDDQIMDRVFKEFCIGK